MSDSDKYHWVFRVHVVDRAGALTSIASAFSNEGINIGTVVGHGLGVVFGALGAISPGLAAIHAHCRNRLIRGGFADSGNGQ